MVLFLLSLLLDLHLEEGEEGDGGEEEEGVVLCRKRKNVLLFAALQVCGVCRVSPALFGTTVWIWLPGQDVSPSLLLLRGHCGLQSAEKGPNPRPHPGVDSSAVSLTLLFKEPFVTVVDEIIHLLFT